MSEQGEHPALTWSEISMHPSLLVQSGSVCMSPEQGTGNDAPLKYFPSSPRINNYPNSGKTAQVY